MIGRRALGGVALGALAALAVAQHAAAQEPRRGGTLTVVYSVETHTLFAPGGGGGNPLLISTKVLERLARLEDDGTFTPQLAEKWTVSPDGREYTFALRRNAKWHDGKPFTADDIVYNAIQHWKAFAGNAALRAIESATAVDPHTVVIRFAGPTPEFLALASLSGTETQIIPKHVYDGTDIRQNPANNAPIGTGPFKVQEWRRGSHVQLVRNAEYWDSARPALDGIVVRYLQDPSARAAAFEVGEVDLGVGAPFPAPEMQRLEKTGKFQATDKGGLQEYMVVEMNTRNPILADKRVRQAIAHAVDKQFVVDVMLSGYGRVATGPVPDAYRTFYNPDVPKFAFDTKQAERLLDAAGHPKKGSAPRFELKLVVGPWYPENPRTGAYIQQALEDVGIKVNLVTPDRAGAIKQIYQDWDFDLSISNNVAYADPLIRSTLLFTTPNIVKTPFRNASGYSNPTLDQLVEAAGNDMDAARRVASLKRFQSIVAEEVPVMVMAYKKNMTFAQPYVRNHSTRPEWMFDSWKEVWLAK